MTPQNPPGWSAGAGVRPLDPGDPESVGTHRLLGRLGEGGMGVVYLGLAPSGRKAAVKVIRGELARDPAFRARFATEVANARRVASFCTARVLDHGESGGAPYLVTEYIDGPSLTDYIKAHGGFPPGALRSLAVGVATALTAIHAVRLVHRDLKPRNVLLAADGPRVIDFGIARALDSEDHHTQTGAVIGSPGYVAPEQAFEGRVGTAVDVFAWGTLVAYAATGRNPFGTGTMPVLAARAQQAMYDLTGVPADLLPIVRAALDPDPARRPAAEDLLVRLVGEQAPEEAATDIIHSEWRPGPIPPPSPPGPRAGTGTSAFTPRTVPPRSAGRRALVAAGATALILLGTTGVVYAVGRRSGERPAEGAAPPTSAKPTVTVTRAPAKQWREVGGLDRMTAECAERGYKETSLYTEGGRKWWCQDPGGALHRIDLAASCRWHYPRFDEVRLRQRPDPGPLYEVHWYCEALV
ncbi:serine/threonine-protein kinase [Actinomadura chibensis]|uniref:serine/threonine-protein kinase n=1 Tax=Actinomadura chibensis TaxID=392828 RepID=UPI00082D73C8|nr:serine/threonine-protein kinase [Actinomadura chibensis]